MNLMFWKKKASGDAEESAADDDKTVAIPREAEPEEELVVRPGLLARLRNTLSALRKPRKPADDAEIPDQVKQATEAPHDGAETPVMPVRNMKKRLVLGAAVGFVVLLLLGAGFAVWKIFLSHPEPQPPAPASAIATHNSEAEPHGEATPPAEAAPPEAPQPEAGKADSSEAEIEALKKKNKELQAQIEALKNEQSQQPPATQNQEAGRSVTAPSPQDGQDMTISNKDPKAAAQALKKAIEEMNKASGGQKADKPAH